MIFSLSNFLSFYLSKEQLYVSSASFLILNLCWYTFVFRTRIVSFLTNFFSIILYMSQATSILWIVVVSLQKHISYLPQNVASILNGLPLFFCCISLFLLIFLYFYLFIPKKTQEYIFYIVSFIPTLVTLVSSFFYPYILLGMSISLLIMLITFLDYTTLLSEETNLLNKDGLLTQLEILRQKNKYFTAILIYIDTMDFLQHGLGTKSFAKLQSMICFSLFGFPKKSLFAAHIAPGCFIQLNLDQTNEEKIIKKIETVFNKSWKSKNSKIKLSARFCVIRIPEDSKNSDIILTSMYRLSRRWQLYPAQKMLSFHDLIAASPQRIFDVQTAIRKAFINRSFELHYQPIVSAATGRTVSAEALIRLNDPELGWISPKEFIPTAEQTGSIHRIGEWVIETACLFLANLDKQKIALQDLEINLSAMQCMQSNLANKMSFITHQYNINPSRLCLEITETASGYSKNQLQTNLEALSRSGFPIAIDDFGTGFANLSNLLAINFTRLKLDKSLIDTLTGPKAKQLEFDQLINLFRAYGTTLIAEGVETTEQIDKVKALGINLIQGYYYSKPLNEEAFIQWLLKENKYVHTSF